MGGFCGMRAIGVKADRICDLEITIPVSAIRHTHHEFQSSTNKSDRTLANPEHGNLD